MTAVSEDSSIRWKEGRIFRVVGGIDEPVGPLPPASIYDTVSLEATEQIRLSVAGRILSSTHEHE